MVQGSGIWFSQQSCFEVLGQLSIPQFSYPHSSDGYVMVAEKVNYVYVKTAYGIEYVALHSFHGDEIIVWAHIPG